MKNIKNVLFIFAFISIVGWGPFSFFENATLSSSLNSSINHPISLGSGSWLANETRVISAQANDLSPEALKTALIVYQNARAKGLDDKQMLTIIDYTKASSDRRMIVVDMKKQKVLFNTWVTHGRESGGTKPTSFSNEPSSLKSSLGTFITDADLSSSHEPGGYALKVRGLEKVNNNAYSRDIEVHGAYYIGHGKTGRSWGCMAVNPDTIKPLINTIKGKTLVVAYYPNATWIKTSPFLT